MYDAKQVCVPAVRLGKTEVMRGPSPAVVMSSAEAVFEQLQFMRRIESAELTMARTGAPGRFFVPEGDGFKEVDVNVYKRTRKPVEWIKSDG